MWKFYQPVDIVLNEGEIHNIDEHMKRHGLSKALIISDPFPAVSDIAHMIGRSINGNCLGITSRVEENPTVHNVDECAAAAKRLGAQCIIAVGGGSTIDCAKLVAAAVRMDKKGIDFISGLTATGSLPVVAVPTTAGTGSEVTAVTIISDKDLGRKGSLVNPVFFPKLAVVDPELTYSCPPKVTASSGIDVLMHAVDAMSSVKANPAADALALSASENVFSKLAVAVAEGSDKNARRLMAEASLLAGMAFSQTGTTGSHACSYYITAKYGIPHGEACALTAHKWLPLNAKLRPQLDDYAGRLGFGDAAGMSEAIQNLKRAVGLRMTLEEAEIPAEDIPEIARQCAAAGNAPNNVCPITEDLVAEILENL